MSPETTTSSSSAPAPAAWPPPCPRPATARACSSSTDDPARPACPAPPASTCAPWRSSAPGASPPPCARTGSASSPRPPRRPPSSRPRGRAVAAGGYPAPREILDVSPVLPLACPQDVLEPVLVDAVRRAGGEIRFGTPLVALTFGPDGVRAELGSGPRVHARFVVGADGTRSTVRAALGIATTHLGTWAHAVQVLFRPGTPPPSAAPRCSPSSTSRTPRRCARWAPGAGPTSACGSTAAGPTSRTTGRRRCGPPPGCPTWRSRCSTSSGSRSPPRSPRPTAPAPGSSSATPRTGRPRSPGSASTPRSTTATSWAGSSRGPPAAWPGRRCSRATTPSGRRSGSPPPRARSTCRAARPTACRAPWATRTAHR